MPGTVFYPSFSQWKYLALQIISNKNINSSLLLLHSFLKKLLFLPPTAYAREKIEFSALTLPQFRKFYELAH